jgi:hypothetical protein
MNDEQLSRLRLGETIIANPDQLRELAAWYRKFADKAGASAIWEQRLMTAEALEREADEIDCRASAHGGVPDIPEN